MEPQDAPEAVVAFKREIAAADALLIVTPEYQQGVPGVLKNALDWASRPPREIAWRSLTASIAGLSQRATS